MFFVYDEFGAVLWFSYEDLIFFFFCGGISNIFGVVVIHCS
jgi:hypothetical protein